MFFSFSRREIRQLQLSKGEKSSALPSSAPELTAATATSSHNERLTIDWLSQSITELRTELVELQEATSNTSRILQQRNQYSEEIIELKEELTKFRLELNALKMRQENTEKIAKELRAEAIQTAEDFRRSRLHVSTHIDII